MTAKLTGTSGTFWPIKKHGEASH